MDVREVGEEIFRWLENPSRMKPREESGEGMKAVRVDNPAVVHAPSPECYTRMH